MVLIKENSIESARKSIEKAYKTQNKKDKKKSERIIVQARDNEFNRKILENNKVDVLLSPESYELQGKDRLKQRNSGLNEVLCNMAAKNNIKIGINLLDLLKVKGKERAIMLSRIIQNINLCKKTGTGIEFFGKYDKKNLFSLLLTLGASTAQAREIISG